MTEHGPGYALFFITVRSVTPTADARLLVIRAEVRKRLTLICQALPATSFDELVDSVALVQLKFEGLINCF